MVNKLEPPSAEAVGEHRIRRVRGDGGYRITIDNDHAGSIVSSLTPLSPPDVHIRMHASFDDAYKRQRSHRSYISSQPPPATDSRVDTPPPKSPGSRQRSANSPLSRRMMTRSSNGGRAKRVSPLRPEVSPSPHPITPENNNHHQHHKSKDKIISRLQKDLSSLKGTEELLRIEVAQRKQLEESLREELDTAKLELENLLDRTRQVMELIHLQQEQQEQQMKFHTIKNDNSQAEEERKLRQQVEAEFHDFKMTIEEEIDVLTRKHKEEEDKLVGRIREIEQARVLEIENRATTEEALQRMNRRVEELNAKLESTEKARMSGEKQLATLEGELSKYQGEVHTLTERLQNLQRLDFQEQYSKDKIESMPSPNSVMQQLSFPPLTPTEGNNNEKNAPEKKESTPDPPPSVMTGPIKMELQNSPKQGEQMEQANDEQMAAEKTTAPALDASKNWIGSTITLLPSLSPGAPSENVEDRNYIRAPSFPIMEINSAASGKQAKEEAAITGTWCGAFP